MLILLAYQNTECKHPESGGHMKAFKKRILFGSEKNLVQASGRRCSTCRVRRDKLHVPGCADEECPACGKALIGCCCDALSPYDAEKIIQGLYAQFENLEKAIESAGEKGARPVENRPICSTQ